MCQPIAESGQINYWKKSDVPHDVVNAGDTGRLVSRILRRITIQKLRSQLMGHGALDVYW